jgi:hypothetical protein
MIPKGRQHSPAGSSFGTLLIPALAIIWNGLGPR